MHFMDPSYSSLALVLVFCGGGPISPQNKLASHNPLNVHLNVSLNVHLNVHKNIHLNVHLNVDLNVLLDVHISNDLIVCPIIHQFI